MTEPAHRRWSSEQDVKTPPEFITTVERRFGPITLDAAASSPNVCPAWFGPGGIVPDGLAVPWPRQGLVWINPPFRHCKDWAQKCAREAEHGTHSLLLTPLSLETRWFEAVEDRCEAIVLRPRLRFVGHKNVFPKGLMLSVFGGERCGVISTWRWKWWK